MRGLLCGLGQGKGAPQGGEIRQGGSQKPYTSPCSKMIARGLARAGFIVYLWLKGPRCFVEYTSLTNPVSREMAESLAGHLKRNATGGRIVEQPSGRLIEEWKDGAAVPVPHSTHA